VLRSSEDIKKTAPNAGRSEYWNTWDPYWPLGAASVVRRAQHLSGAQQADPGVSPTDITHNISTTFCFYTLVAHEAVAAQPQRKSLSVLQQRMHPSKRSLAAITLKCRQQHPPSSCIGWALLRGKSKRALLHPKAAMSFLSSLRSTAEKTPGCFSPLAS
jgi:hypothetical protein